jgi:molecular chaperone GrpE (heat shock protein)
MTDPLLESDDLGGTLSPEVLLAHAHLEQVRHEAEAEVRSMLLTLAEAVDDVGRLCDDPSAPALPPGWHDGLAVLRDKLLWSLAAHGATPMAVLGQPLDPRLHHVVEVCAGPGEPDTVVRQVRPGYLWRGRVLRPAEVVTVAGPTER